MGQGRGERGCTSDNTIVYTDRLQLCGLTA